MRAPLYVGWQPRAPRALGARMRWVALALVAASGLVAVVGAARHRRLALSTFEYGERRTFVGTLLELPYPALAVARPGASGDLPSHSLYPLVGEGKRGLDGTRDLAGRAVRLAGSLIYRDDRTMVEVSGPIELASDLPAAPAPAGVSLGERSLVGEIVDSKCFLGVMNPGHLKPHRACAARCISGGIPPVLCVRDETGRALYVLLADADGGPVNRRVLPYVAEPVEVTGELVSLDGALLLRVGPDGIRRRE